MGMTFMTGVLVREIYEQYYNQNNKVPNNSVMEK
jgi:hypothetical protein